MLRLCACDFVLFAAACDTLDLSQPSCGLAEGRRLKQCRDMAGAGQPACEDQCRTEADMCKAPGHERS